jgi:hypothetical protein
MSTTFDSPFVIAGVTIVDTADGTHSQPVDVRIADGRIVNIALANDAANDAANQRRIDARGRFLVPGFLDMHAHVADAPASPEYRDVLLAHGITGFRQMSGSTQLLEERRSADHSDDGPRLLAMPGEILTPQNAATPEAASAEVRRQHALGADFIKVLDVPKPAFFAALAQALALGVPPFGRRRSIRSTRRTPACARSNISDRATASSPDAVARVMRPRRNPAQAVRRSPRRCRRASNPRPFSRA